MLLTCSDSDTQAYCDAERPLIEALGHTALTVVELKGVNHVLRDDPSGNVANYAKQDRCRRNWSARWTSSSTSNR